MIGHRRYLSKIITIKEKFILKVEKLQHGKEVKEKIPKVV
jgi:hypothetical protein